MVIVFYELLLAIIKICLFENINMSRFELLLNIEHRFFKDICILGI